MKYDSKRCNHYFSNGLTNSGDVTINCDSTSDSLIMSSFANSGDFTYSYNQASGQALSFSEASTNSGIFRVYGKALSLFKGSQTELYNYGSMCLKNTAYSQDGGSLVGAAGNFQSFLL